MVQSVEMGSTVMGGFGVPDSATHVIEWSRDHGDPHGDGAGFYVPGEVPALTARQTAPARCWRRDVTFQRRIRRNCRTIDRADRGTDTESGRTPASSTARGARLSGPPGRKSSRDNRRHRAARKGTGLAVQWRHQSRTVLTRVRGRCHSEPLPLLQPDRISKFAPMPTQFPGVHRPTRPSDPTARRRGR
jgi:hypothetical protein